MAAISLEIFFPGSLKGVEDADKLSAGGLGVRLMTDGYLPALRDLSPMRKNLRLAEN